jgi:hypothetical protein
LPCNTRQRRRALCSQAVRRLSSAALGRVEIRHNLIVAVLAGLQASPTANGGRSASRAMRDQGEGAIDRSGRPECPAMLCARRGNTFARLSAVVGADGPRAGSSSAPARWRDFLEQFAADQVLRDKPVYPGVRGPPGSAPTRRYSRWTVAFVRGDPQDRMPSRNASRSPPRRAASSSGSSTAAGLDGRHRAARATPARSRRHAAHLRGQGHGGSVTAAVVDAILRKPLMACLSTLICATFIPAAAAPRSASARVPVWYRASGPS